ncbi:MAG: peptide deformylase [Desulfurivibrio sp.]
MAILPIVQFPVAVLKSRAKPVTVFDEKLRRLVADMIATMHAAPGVGLAAPQVGVPLQVVVIAGRVTGTDQVDEEDGEEEQPTPADKADEEQRNPSLVLINPRIVAGEGQQVDEEGCLSVRDYCSNVKRLARIQVEALDLEGRPLSFTAEDFFARVIQHEIDHLEGTLFIDRISSLKRTLYRKKLKKILTDQRDDA